MYNPSLDALEQRILLIRGRKVLLDADLAALYGVPTKALLQAVKRNSQRFPDDFVFQLTATESQIQRSQTVTFTVLNRKYLPFCFTEQGVAMLSSVLRSERAVQVNIAIMRALMLPPVKPRKAIGFHAAEGRVAYRATRSPRKKRPQ